MKNLHRALALTALLPMAAVLKAAAAGDGEAALGAAAQDLSAAVKSEAQGIASQGPASAPAPVPGVERLDMPGLPNLALVEKGVYRGGRPQLDQGAIASLQKLGIKNIIDLQGGDLTAPSKVFLPDWADLISKQEPGEMPSAIAAEAVAAAVAGIAAVDIPLDSLDPITDLEADSLDRILEMLAASSPEQPVYVHCEHGKDRTGLVVALYRMRYDGWSQEQASAEMKEMGHTGLLDELFTGNMDLSRVLPRFPSLAAPAQASAP